MKIDQIIGKTFGMRRESAGYVKTVQFKTGKDKDGHPYAAAQTYSTMVVNVHRKVVPAQDRNKYVSKITYLDKKLNVKLMCTCPDFMFTWEVALAKAKAADIMFSNGEPPDERNPGYVAGCCKHIIALRGTIKKKYNI